MSEQAILGSLQLWINYQSHDHADIFKEVAKEELVQHNVVEEIDEKEENEDGEENEKEERHQEPQVASQI
jgi:hypothetical protein